MSGEDVAVAALILAMIGAAALLTLGGVGLWFAWDFIRALRRADDGTDEHATVAERGEGRG